MLPENLTGGHIHAAFGHHAESALRMTRDKLAEEADPGRLGNHLVVADVSVTLHTQEQIGLNWLRKQIQGASGTTS